MVWTNDRETSSPVSTSTTNDRAGLESIALVCLQALQRNQHEKNDDNQETPALLPPPPPPEITARVVSIEKIGEGDDGSSTSSQRIEENPTNTFITNAVDFSASSSPADSVSDTCKNADFSQILADPEAWFRQTENMFGKLPPIEKSDVNSDIVVQPEDVLCGRGGETNHHPGNVQYRSLVKAYQKLYLLAKRREKPKIAQCIVVSVRGVGGRFLKRTTTANGPSWVDVGNVKAREKTSQALREGAPDLRQNVTTKNSLTTASNNSCMKETTSSPLPSFFYNNHIDQSHAVSSADSFSSSNVRKDALTTNAFASAADSLMQHPIFRQLTPSQQQEAVMLEQGRTSPIQSQYSHHQQQQRYPPHVYGHSYYQQDQYAYYMNNNNNTTNNSNTSSAPNLNCRKIDLQSIYREVLAAKAVAVASGNTTNDVLKTTNESVCMKKRKATRLMISPTIISDTGSDVSSSSSIMANNCDSISSTASNSMNKNTGGPRLKRFKLRLNKDPVN